MPHEYILIVNNYKSAHIDLIRGEGTCPRHCMPPQDTKPTPRKLIKFGCYHKLISD